MAIKHLRGLLRSKISAAQKRVGNVWYFQRNGFIFKLKILKEVRFSESLLILLEIWVVWNNVGQKHSLMASSNEPGRPGWPGFRDLALCSYERAGWLGFRDLGKRAGNFCHMNTSSRLPGWTAGWILAVRMASSCIACCIFHIISIPFNCSDTALGVTDAKIGPKVKIFVFRYVCFVSQIWRQNSSPGSLTFSHLGNRAEISHMNPRQNSSR